MHVYLDSNIFHNNWHLDAAPFRPLARYLNNEGHTLLLSRLVIEEVENLYRRALDAAYQKMSDGSKDFGRLTHADALVLPDRPGHPSYDLHSLVSDQFDQVVVVEYDALPQSVVTARALKSRRPFRENEKGYRDTLIWLSLLEHLKKKNYGDHVAFITNNASDFFAPKGSSLHSDLLEDVNAYALPCSIEPFESLATFVEAKVQKDADALDRSRAITEFSQFPECETISFIELGNDEFRRQLGRLIVAGSDALSRASPISASFTEGLEDFDYLDTRDLDSDEVFVSCAFDLRIVQLVMDIPVHDFYADCDEIRASPLVIEANADGPVATVTALVRPAFKASFIFNRKRGECRGFSVEQWALVGRGQWASSALRLAQGQPEPASPT